MMSDISCHNLGNLEQCCFPDDPGGGAFAFFIGPTPGHLVDLFVPTPRNLPFFVKKKKERKRLLGRGGGGYGHCCTDD